MRTAFARTPEFQPRSFVCWAYPKEIIDGTWKGRWVRREFRSDGLGSWTMVEVHDDDRTAWYRRTIARLKRAGYERWFELDDETVLRRWVRGVAEQRRELQFLHALGTTATPPRWPRRSQSKRPKRPHVRLEAAIELASASPITWDEWSNGWSRSEQIGDLGVSVTVIGIESLQRPTRYHVSVSVTFQPTTNASTRRAITRVVRSSGFSGGKPAKPWFGAKTVVRATAAAREARRILDRIVVSI